MPSSSSISLAESVDVEYMISSLGDSAPDSLGGFDICVSYDSSTFSLDDVAFGDPALGDQLDLFGFGSITDVILGTGSVNSKKVALDHPDDLDALQPNNFVLAALIHSAIGVGTSDILLGFFDISNSFGFSLAPDSTTGSNVPVSSVRNLPLCG